MQSIPLSCAVAAFLRHRQLRGVSAASLNVYARQLRTWQQWRDRHAYPPNLEQIDIDELRGYVLYLRTEHVPHSGNPRRPALPDRRLTPASIDQAWRVLAAFWRFVAVEGYLTEEQSRYFANDRVPRPRVPEGVRPAVDESILDRLVAICDQSRSEEERWRDRAIMLLLAESGMRNSELCRLRDEDVDLEMRSAALVGKGDKPRAVFWGSAAARALHIYLTYRRGGKGGPLIRGLGSRSRGHMATSAIRDMLKRRAAQAGLTLPSGAPAHAFRHGFARRSLRKGMPSLHLQQLLGHANPAMTLRYVREETAQLRDIHQSFWAGNVLE